MPLCPESAFVTRTSVAPLTFGPHLRRGASPNVRGKSYTRNVCLLVFLAALTFALSLVEAGSKCQRRNTSAATRP